MAEEVQEKDLIPAEQKQEEKTGEEPAGEEPAAKEPAGEEPAAEEPAGEEPAAEEPAGEEPAAEELAGEEPAAEVQKANEESAAIEQAEVEPAAEEPAAGEPAAEEPAAEEPTAEEPAAEEPVAEGSTAVEQESAEPETKELEAGDKGQGEQEALTEDKLPEDTVEKEGLDENGVSEGAGDEAGGAAEDAAAESSQEITQEQSAVTQGNDNKEDQPERSTSPPPQIVDHVQTPVPPTQTMALGTEDTQEPQADVDPHAASPTPQYDKDAQATGKATFDGYTLAELGVGPNGTVQLEMQSSDPLNTPIRQFKPRQEYHMPDVITVKVPSDDGGFKEVVVEVERATRKKPFLGGYRHKKTSVEFHHAASQTVQKAPAPSNVERFCRDTQTVEQRNIVQQTTNNMSTQMTKVGVYVSNLTDKIVTPGKYTTADEYRTNIMSKIVVIQKYYRRWLAKRYVEKVRVDKHRRLEWEREEEIRKKKEKEDRIKHEFQRRMNPKSKEDFDLLYHALEKWYSEEKTRIDSSLTGAERKAALCQLLEQETQLIASVGRHKIEADSEMHQKQIQAFLNKAASPKKWKGRDGKTTEMDTPYTIRAQELKDIYNSINMKYLTQDERLDVLLTLKHTVKEHDCKLTQEIIELIDREADLLMRGVKESNLEGLRKRISTLFLQYIKTPTFNPEAARLLKVPQDPSSLRKNIYFCPSCNQYLPSTEFQMSSNSRTVGKCRRCKKIDNDGRVRQDYSHYRYMLGTLRTAEKEYGDVSKMAFLLQETDLRHLVENVWNSQSVISAWEDLYDLVLVRWDRHEEWSPWNCILITKEEATAHQKLENLEEAYGKVFVHKVKRKHTLARNYFSRLPGMAEYLREKDLAEQEANNNVTISGKGLSIVQAKA